MNEGHPLTQHRHPAENGHAPITAQNSVTVAMAERYGMDARAFEATVRATCGLANASREEFAALLLVAKELELNPLTREIMAFPKRGGGIVPIVPIDGWISLVNRHPAFDGMEFVETMTKDTLISTTCRLYRKDRSRPVEVTEYYSECKRETDPWKMKHRMLRHKAMIQCARYAFGFSGIYDEEEGAVIAEAKDITPPPPPPPPPAPYQEPDRKAVLEAGIEQVKAILDKPEPYPDLPATLDRRKRGAPYRKSSGIDVTAVVEAEVLEEPKGLTPEELAAYLDEQGIKAPSEVDL